MVTKKEKIEEERGRTGERERRKVSQRQARGGNGGERWEGNSGN